MKDHRSLGKKRALHVVAVTIGTLFSVAAIVVLVSAFVFPTIMIFGTSMSPTLHEDDIALAIKGSDFRKGDVIAFYNNNKILVKRVIGTQGDWVNIRKDGTVYVNNEKLDEPYVLDPSLGNCDIELPYQVPEDSYFVMGDQRTTSVDSRTLQIGCVPARDVVGKIFFCVWPTSSIGIVS